MTLPAPPPKWGQDEISKFLDDARGNEYATFANLTGEIDRFIDIDWSYRKAIEGLNHSNKWFTGFFVARAHSNFLAACRMGWSGQIPECHAILRSCLENALYGLYFAHNPDSQESWLRRHDSAESKKRIRNEFTIGKMLTFAKSLSKEEGEKAEKLYENAIDHGAHPNERAVMQMIQTIEKPNHDEFKLIYLVDDVEHLKSTMKTTAQTGVCTLSLFRSIYKERFDILGVTATIDHIKKGL